MITVKQRKNNQCCIVCWFSGHIAGCSLELSSQSGWLSQHHWKAILWPLVHWNSVQFCSSSQPGQSGKRLHTQFLSINVPSLVHWNWFGFNTTGVFNVIDLLHYDLSRGVSTRLRCGFDVFLCFRFLANSGMVQFFFSFFLLTHFLIFILKTI